MCLDEIHNVSSRVSRSLRPRQPGVSLFRGTGGRHLRTAVRLRHRGHQRRHDLSARSTHLSELQTETAASSLLAGCILGASVGGWLSDRFGRRRVLMISAVLFALSAFGAACARNLPEFAAGGFIGGIAIGAASVLAPLYIAEVSPARNRGRLVALNQMAIVSGILVAYLVNWLLSFGGPSSWRWMFASAAIPAAAFLAGLFFVPESPRWLVEKGRSAEALAVLARVNGRSAGLQEVREIEETVAAETGTLAELFQPGLRRALWIAVSLAILQQITGINTVLFYGSLIFQGARRRRQRDIGHLRQRAGRSGQFRWPPSWPWR